MAQVQVVDLEELLAAMAASCSNGDGDHGAGFVQCFAGSNESFGAI